MAKLTHLWLKTGQFSKLISIKRLKMQEVFFVENGALVSKQVQYITSMKVSE
jgi:hypothetical protein